MNTLDVRVWIVLIHLAATLFMTGLIWFVQIVHYPLFKSVGESAFLGYESEHVRRTSWVVGPAMLVELVTALLIVLWPDPFASVWLRWGGTALLIVAWASTAALQIPCHRRLEQGFEPRVHRRLVTTNWVRTVAWSGRSVLAVMMLTSLT